MGNAALDITFIMVFVAPVLLPALMKGFLTSKVVQLELCAQSLSICAVFFDLNRFDNIKAKYTTGDSDQYLMNY